MERSAFGKAEDTALYENGVPICLKCVALQEAKSKKDYSVHDILVRDLTEATLRTKSATTELNAVTSDVPSSIPQPDGTQRIHNASHKLTETRNTMTKAHRAALIKERFR